MIPFYNNSIETVKYHIDNQDFDGPLDLLVKMVKDAQIDIMNIFISDITEQYIAFVQSMQELDYEYVSQYIIMAATLMEIKSYRMLPYEEEDDNFYYEEMREAEQQILSDVERRIAQDMPEKLKPREVVNLFYAEPEYDENDYKVVATSLTIEKLSDAIRLVLEKDIYINNNNEPKVIKKDSFTVAEKAQEIAETLKEVKQVRFFSLFKSEYSRSEILGIFLAVLELLKKQIATAEQEKDKDIVLYINENHTKEQSTTEGGFFNDVGAYN